MKHLLGAILIMIVGLIIGGGFRYVRDRGAESPVFVSTTKDAKQETAVEAFPKPRPPFDEVIEAKGTEVPNVLAHYLKEATIDEVLVLLNMMDEGEMNLTDHRWMVEIRGLELDPQAMVDQARPHPFRAWDLFKRWCLIDPAAALQASFQEEPDRIKGVLSTIRREGYFISRADLDKALVVARDQSLEPALIENLEALKWSAYAKEDVEGALKDAMNIQDEGERKRGMETVINEWIEKDPVASLEWLESQEDLEGVSDLIEKGIEKLAETQPAVAWSKTQTMASSWDRANLEAQVTNQWAEQDPEGALAWLKSQPEGAARDHLFASLIPGLNKQPEELLDLIQELGIDVNRSDQMFKFQLQTGPNYGYSGSGSDTVKQSIQRAAFELAKDSPQEALKALYRLNFDTEVTQQITERWVKDSPEEATEWAASLPENDYASSLQESIFGAWGKQSPEETAAFLTEHDLALKPDLSQVLSIEWVRQDAEAALGWVDQLEPDVREGVFNETLSEAAKSDPVVALQYLNQVGDIDVQQTILEEATQTWRATDPEATMAWLNAQPEEARVDHLLKDSSKAWVLDNPIAASQWIEGMDVSPRRDQAVAGMVHALISSQNPNKDFEAAELWVNTIADPDLRQQWENEIGNRR